MKIGNSLGRCIRDIVEDKVDYDDVLVIVTRTRIEQEEHLDGVIDHYLGEPSYLMGLDRDACVALAHRLYRDGKLHQPRLVGATPGRVGNDSVWLDAVPTEIGDNPVVQSAWEAYRLALTMASSRPARFRAPEPPRAPLPLDNDF